MATPPSPPWAQDTIDRELTFANAIVSGSEPTYPGINTYVANDGSSPIPVAVLSGSSATGTIGTRAYGSTSVLLLAANGGRLGFIVYNDSSSAYALTFGATASLSLFTTVIPGGWTFESQSPAWQGPVSGIGADSSGSGTIYVTELLP